jgi:hypothetical protein
LLQPVPIRKTAVTARDAMRTRLALMTGCSILASDASPRAPAGPKRYTVSAANRRTGGPDVARRRSPRRRTKRLLRRCRLT